MAFLRVWSASFSVILMVHEGAFSPLLNSSKQFSIIDYVDSFFEAIYNYSLGLDSKFFYDRNLSAFFYFSSMRTGSSKLSEVGTSSSSFIDIKSS